MQDAPLTPEQLADARRQLAREAAKARWSKATAEERKAEGQRLHEGRAKLTKAQRSEIASKAGKAGGRGRPKKVKKKPTKKTRRKKAG